MKISLITFTHAMLFCLSAVTQPLIASELWIKQISLTSSLVVSNDFSVHGIQSNYWLNDGQGQIEMTITAHEHLLITSYLYDLNGNEKTRAEILINNRTKDLSLPLENLVAGNYKLVIKALNTDNQSAIKKFNIALTHFSEN
ncbi:hypothetical protein [Yersinia pekkanenii]|uniref:N-acetylglucosamine-binding protein A n=1 Tax=Yersinia pekkanenii TaxID=1288385 RepID=A0A0T9NDH9_9GAMM|nr:hypothetical protein [Yersinia pekkanenii]CNH00456.1 N-acetylglucosamine-binding protein A [Yersinia pekkanenii]CRY64108.1 N-acetylglucosamine-binding protein A [Yersinia pekkanenii]